MKKIYLLALIALISIGAKAQNSDMEMIQYIPANSTILADADNPRSYVFYYGFKNNGPDAVTSSDTIYFRTAYGAAFYYRPSNGIAVGDTLILTDTARITPGGGIPSSMENPNYQWCDSMWSSASINDNNINNNKHCTTVNAVFWTTGVNNVTNDNGIALYPNPANTQVNIKYNFNGNSNGYIAVRDITGKLLYKQEIEAGLSGEKIFTIDVTKFSAGLHIVELVTDGNKAVTKFSVQ